MLTFCYLHNKSLYQTQLEGEEPTKEKGNLNFSPTAEFRQNSLIQHFRSLSRSDCTYNVLYMYINPYTKFTPSPSSSLPLLPRPPFSPYLWQIVLRGLKADGPNCLDDDNGPKCALLDNI